MVVNLNRNMIGFKANGNGHLPADIDCYPKKYYVRKLLLDWATPG